MHGNPADGTNSAINVTPTKKSARLKQKRKNQQKKIKHQKNKNINALNKKRNKRKRKNKNSSKRRGRQVCICDDTPGIDHCLIGGPPAVGCIVTGICGRPGPELNDPAPVPPPPPPPPAPQPLPPDQTMILAMQMSGTIKAA